VLHDQDLSFSNLEMRVTTFTTELLVNPDLTVSAIATDYKICENCSLIILFLYDEKLTPPTNPFDFAEVNNATHTYAFNDNAISGFYIQPYDENEYNSDEIYVTSLDNYIYFPFASNSEDPYKFQMIIYHLGEGNSQIKLIIEQVDSSARTPEHLYEVRFFRNIYLIFFVIWSIPILIYYWARQYR
jgi:hypothetical protein